MNADQLAAFASNGGFTADACAVVLLSGLFAVLLLFGAWSIRTAYVGWAENQLSARQLLGVIVRFVAMYLALTYLLLS